MKGLIVDIFKSNGQSFDCGRGISSKCEKVTLVSSEDFKVDEIFEADEDAPAVMIVKRNIGGEYLTAYPVNMETGEIDKGGRMAGGCFISCCDGRFNDIARYPVPLHDRKEWD